MQQTIDSLQRTIDKLPADEVSSEAPVISSTYAPSDLENTALHVLPEDSYETAISKLHKSILDDERVTAAAISAVNDSIGLTETFAYTPESADLSGKNLTRTVDYIRSLIS